MCRWVCVWMRSVRLNDSECGRMILCWMPGDGCGCGHWSNTRRCLLNSSHTRLAKLIGIIFGFERAGGAPASKWRANFRGDYVVMRRCTWTLAFRNFQFLAYQWMQISDDLASSTEYSLECKTECSGYSSLIQFPKLSEEITSVDTKKGFETCQWKLLLKIKETWSCEFEPSI